MVGRFIAGIGALIWNPVNDTYLLLRRSDEKDFGSGNWECVTGRVDQGESFEQALHREVFEEIGVRVNVEFIIGTSHFYRGEPTPENELLGVVYCCTLADVKPLQISAEHSECRWVTAVQAFKLLEDANPAHGWLRQVINRAEVTQQRLDMELRSFHWFNGFETSR